VPLLIECGIYLIRLTS